MDESSTPPTGPFMRFYHSEKLRAKTLTVLDNLEQAKDSTQHRGHLSGLVVELLESGIDYYFMRPLKLAKVGFVVEQSAIVGMSGSIRVLASLIHSIIGRMDKTQLLIVCRHIRHLME
jgi:hypothetical protein